MTEQQTTAQRLASELRKANAPAIMIERALAGAYDDFTGQLLTPLVQLILDCELSGLKDLEIRARAGEFAPQDWEGEKWARSNAGRQMLEQLMRGPAAAPAGPVLKFAGKKRRR